MFLISRRDYSNKKIKYKIYEPLIRRKSRDKNQQDYEEEASGQDTKGDEQSKENYLLSSQIEKSRKKSEKGKPKQIMTTRTTTSKKAPLSDLIDQEEQIYDPENNPYYQAYLRCISQVENEITASPSSSTSRINWSILLESQRNEAYFIKLMNFLYKEAIIDKKTIYPSPELVFASLTATCFEDTKVVILGQDPYHGEVCRCYDIFSGNLNNLYLYEYTF